jgi:hypothetical protein
MSKRPRRTTVPVNRTGDGPLRFHGAPCDICGRPVTTMRGNCVVVLEPEKGRPFWSAKHHRCARRESEVLRRR